MQSNSPTKTRSTTASLAASAVAPWLLLAACAIIVVLQVVGVYLNNINVWGVSLWGVFPSWAVLVAAGVYLVISVPAVAAGVARPFPYLWTAFQSTAQKLPRPVRWMSMLAGFAALGWFFRSRALIYGDGFSAMAQGTRPLSEVFATVHDYLRPLTVLLNWLSWSALQSNATVGPQAFWIVSVAGGVVGWAGLVAVTRTLSARASDRAIIFLSVLTSGCVALLLGWVELYVWPTALLIWLIVIAIRYTQHRASAWLLILVATLAALSEALLIPVAGAMVLMAARLRGDIGWIDRLVPRPSRMFLLLTGSAVALGVLMNLSGESFFVVPLVANAANPYWTFSLAHLADVANLFVFLAPAAVVLLVSYPGLRFKQQAFDHPAILLGLASWTCLLISFWIDPKLGAARDWDLLSFYGLPLSLFAGYLLARVTLSERWRRLLIVQLVLLVATLNLPNIYEKTHATVSIQRIEPLLWVDLHNDPSYLQAYGCISVGSILQDQCDRPDLAEKYFRRRLSAVPNDDLALYNLGQAAFERQDYRAAADLFERAYAVNPASDEYCLKLALSLQPLGERDRARELIRDFDVTSLTEANALRSLGIVFARDGMLPQAIATFRQIFRSGTASCEDYCNMGLAFGQAGAPDSAISYFLAATEHCTEAKRCDILQALLLEQLKIGKYDDAAGTFAEYAGRCPSATDLAYFEQRIASRR